MITEYTLIIGYNFHSFIDEIKNYSNSGTCEFSSMFFGGYYYPSVNRGKLRRNAERDGTFEIIFLSQSIFDLCFF